MNTMHSTAGEPAAPAAAHTGVQGTMLPAAIGTGTPVHVYKLNKQPAPASSAAMHTHTNSRYELSTVCLEAQCGGPMNESADGVGGPVEAADAGDEAADGAAPAAATGVQPLDAAQPLLLPFAAAAATAPWAVAGGL